MNKKSQVLIIAIILIIIAIGLAYFFLSKSGSEEKQTPSSESEETREGLRIVTETLPTQKEETIEENTIEITSSGFSPSSLTVSQGDKITFINRGSSLSWPASAVHPTHRAYPGSDINKCNTAEEKNIFDACRGLKQGESYSFTFNDKGSWKYHDHLNTGSFGEIVVE